MNTHTINSKETAMRLRTALVWCVALVCGVATAQDATELVPAERLPGGVILVVKDLAGAANPGSPIYLASNYVGWNPGDPTMKLQGRSDLRWQIVLPQSTRDQRLAFKFTRGMWETAECTVDYAPIENRLLPMVDPSTVPADEPYLVEFEIPAWDDQSPDSRAEIAAVDPSARMQVAGGEVVKLEFAGGGGAMRGVARELLIWLPPGYDNAANANRTYPVLYMHDGQHLFEQVRGTEEWRVDETLVEMIEADLAEPCIVVGVPNAGSSRAAEYLMVDAIEGVEPDADRYVAILADQIVPRVEAAVRARRDRSSRIVGGASLGGLISLYAAHQRPEVFGSVLAESPSITLRGRTIWTEVLSTKPASWPDRVFLGGGEHEFGADEAERNAAYARELRSLAGVYEANGTQTELLITPEAEHNEAAWADRFDDAVRFLFR